MQKLQLIKSISRICVFTLCPILLNGCFASPSTPDAITKQWALTPPAEDRKKEKDASVTPLFDEKLQTRKKPQTLSSPETPAKVDRETSSASSTSTAAPIPDWEPLIAKLQADGLEESFLRSHFSNLEGYSAEPMSIKVKELYRNAFVRKKAAQSDGPRIPSKSRIYKGFVTKENVEKCKRFLLEHKVAFDTMEKEYGIPREIIASLLFVETKLGTFMGKEKAFWSLAAMALATSPDMVKEGISSLPLTKNHGPWLQEKLNDKSAWAYKEVKALLVHCTINDLDPHSMPGSVYGAIGICQFMPSNLVPYGADGNKDGKIDLFEPADAIHSAAKYLKGHGWGKKPSVDQQRNTIKRYNNLTTYANTIITLAESIKTGVLQTAPPDAPKNTPSSGKKSNKQTRPAQKNVVKTPQKNSTGAKKIPKRSS